MRYSLFNEETCICIWPCVANWLRVGSDAAATPCRVHVSDGSDGAEHGWSDAAALHEGPSGLGAEHGGPRARLEAQRHAGHGLRRDCARPVAAWFRGGRCAPCHQHAVPLADVQLPAGRPSGDSGLLP